MEVLRDKYKTLELRMGNLRLASKMKPSPTSSTAGPKPCCNRKMWVPYRTLLPAA
jgi:hypothetical protein